MSSQLQPEALAVLRILLTTKSGYRPYELSRQGLDWRSETTWFHAFTHQPSSQEDLKRRSKYLDYALRGLLYRDIRPLLRSNAMGLQEWEIFIHNLQLADPDKIESLVSSTLQDLSERQFEALFVKSGLINIGYFLRYFDIREPLFDWSLPTELDFSRIDLAAALRSSTLGAVAHFLFNFYLIGAGHWSHHFGERLGSCILELEPLVEAADYKTIDFFYWNWWLAMPQGDVPVSLRDGIFTSILTQKPLHDATGRQSLLGVIGTLHFADCDTPSSLLRSINPPETKRLALAAVSEGDIRAIRLLGGLKAVLEEALSDQEKSDCREFLLAVHNELNIPNMTSACSRLESWLHTDS